jgi:hypothetical protein
MSGEKEKRGGIALAIPQILKEERKRRLRSQKERIRDSFRFLGKAEGFSGNIRKNAKHFSVITLKIPNPYPTENAFGVFL